MDDTYDFQRHSHAMLTSASFGTLDRDKVETDEWREPFVVLHYVPHGSGDRVWVSVTYHGADIATSLGGVQVGDGLTDGRDIAGDAIWSLPAALFGFCDHEEAAGIAECIDIDDRMLANAR